jgi:hypothetical protein
MLMCSSFVWLDRRGDYDQIDLGLDDEPQQQQQQPAGGMDMDMDEGEIPRRVRPFSPPLFSPSAHQQENGSYTTETASISDTALKSILKKDEENQQKAKAAGKKGKKVHLAKLDDELIVLDDGQCASLDLGGRGDEIFEEDTS